jgi:hypothetical protein
MPFPQRPKVFRDSSHKRDTDREIIVIGRSYNEQGECYKVLGRQLHVHSRILMSRSRVFKDILTGLREEDQTKYGIERSTFVLVATVDKEECDWELQSKGSMVCLQGNFCYGKAFLIHQSQLSRSRTVETAINLFMGPINSYISL